MFLNLCRQQYGDLDDSNDGLFKEHDDAVQQNSETTTGGDLMKELAMKKVKDAKLEQLTALTVDGIN